MTGRVLARKGPLEVRLTTDPVLIRACQKLRYDVFYTEMSAIADPETDRSGHDADRFDGFCDHLVVIDYDAAAADIDAVIGTYRLLPQHVAARHGGFYTEGEFDLKPLLARKADLRFLELGRSCVKEAYRTKPTLELMWQAIWNYVRERELDVMVGCASLHGTDPDILKLPLSFLHHHTKLPRDWRVRAREELYVDMNRMEAADIDMRAALKSLPPLVKGYLRIGAYIGDGAVIDAQFGTIDVLIILPVTAISDRYLTYFGKPENA